MSFFSRAPSSNAAIKIVQPTAGMTVEENKKQSPRKEPTQRHCRNVLIYGSCKYQDKGCIYYHPPQTQDFSSPPPPFESIHNVTSPAMMNAIHAPPSSTPIRITAPGRTSSPSVSARTSSPSVQGRASTPNPPRVATPTTPTRAKTPSTPRRMSSPIPPTTHFASPSSSISAEAVNAPVFVPKSSSFAAFTSPTLSHAEPVQAQTQPSYSYGFDDPQDQEQQEQPTDDLDAHMQSMDVSDYPVDYMDPSAYYPLPPPPPPFTRQPLNYHLYTAPIPPIHARYFLPQDIRESLTQRAEITHTTPPAEALESMGLPDETQGYHSFVPLEPTPPDRRGFGNWLSVVYKAISTKDGGMYVLRRIENFRLSGQSAFSSIPAWESINHPNVATVREAFTTRAFKDNSVVVVYDYYPGARTLRDIHFPSQSATNSTNDGTVSTLSSTSSTSSSSSFSNLRRGSNGTNTNSTAQTPIPERTLWSYMIQIASALRAVHEAGLAVRVLDISKILVVGNNRIRIGSCALADILSHTPNVPADANMPQYQQEDLAALGRLLFQLTTLNATGAPNFKALEALSRTYSADIKNVLLWCLGSTGKPGMPRTATQLLEIIGAGRVAREMEEAASSVDRLEGELMGELENGRLVRLLTKFGFINERPEFARDARWSETGDRYIVKLFRDFVFHQVDESGTPVLSLSHVLACLNKLDAGTDERIMLVSRDEQSCLVVSYKEVKACVESAFQELAQSASGR